MDMPLIIKVASIPKERMQVYFIDSEDYFKEDQVMPKMKIITYMMIMTKDPFFIVKVSLKR